MTTTTHEPTHTFIGTVTCDDETSPFTGLHVTLVHYYGNSQSGCNCLVRLHCTAHELAARHNATKTRGPDYTEECIEEIYGRGVAEALDGSGLYVDCDIHADLVPYGSSEVVDG